MCPRYRISRLSLLFLEGGELFFCSIVIVVSGDFHIRWERTVSLSTFRICIRMVYELSGYFLIKTGGVAEFGGNNFSRQFHVYRRKYPDSL